MENFYAHARILREAKCRHAFHVNIWSSEAADNCCPCAMPEQKKKEKKKQNRIGKAKRKAQAAGQQISLDGMPQ